MNYRYENFQEHNFWYIIPFPDFNLPRTQYFYCLGPQIETLGSYNSVSR